jgi:hypothetical protein
VGKPDWRAWAPPLYPPTAGGLPEDEAAAIAADWWDEEPHLAAALMWEAWAATLPPALPVAQVATGSQSVSYSPPQPGGQYGQAISRAQWHRAQLGSLGTAQLVVPRPVRLPSGWLFGVGVEQP